MDSAGDLIDYSVRLFHLVRKAWLHSWRIGVREIPQRLHALRVSVGCDSKVEYLARSPSAISSGRAETSSSRGGDKEEAVKCMLLHSASLAPRLPLPHDAIAPTASRRPLYQCDRTLSPSDAPARSPSGLIIWPVAVPNYCTTIT